MKMQVLQQSCLASILVKSDLFFPVQEPHLSFFQRESRGNQTLVYETTQWKSMQTNIRFQLQAGEALYSNRAEQEKFFLAESKTWVSIMLTKSR